MGPCLQCGAGDGGLHRAGCGLAVQDHQDQMMLSQLRETMRYNSNAYLHVDCNLHLRCLEMALQMGVKDAKTAIVEAEKLLAFVQGEGHRD